MHHGTSRRRLALFAWAVFLSAALPVTINAQEQLGNTDNTKNPIINARFKSLLEGKEKDPDAVKDKLLLENAGRYFVYRVTWLTLQSEKFDSGMGSIQAEFKNVMYHAATLNGDNRQFMKLLAPQVIERLKEVLKLDFRTNTTAVTNAALLLPLLAKCKQNEVHDYLLEIARQEPAGKPGAAFVRMCAIKGLGELNNPGAPQLDDLKNAQELAGKRDRELARMDAIWKFILQPYPPEGKTPDHDAALAFVRREGVKALAQLRTPAYKIDKGQATGPVAHLLLHIANGGAVQAGPPFTLAEKLEAAIGLCQLEARETPKYKQEVAAFVVANVLVEFAREYDNDIKLLKAGKKDEPKRQALLPWQAYANRLEDGLKTLYTNMKDSPAASKAEGLRSKAITDLLSRAKNRAEVEPVGLPEIAAALRPASGEIYEGCKDNVLPLGER